MFSRYLLLAKKEGGITTTDATQIADEVLATPQYTKTTRVVYNETNLHVIDKSDKQTLKKYADALNQYLMNAANQIKNLKDPLSIFSSAITTEDQILSLCTSEV